MLDNFFHGGLMMEPLVTVGIAAYNIEKFLVRGMQSVFGQTYKNIEIILVDDGSTDGTAKICDKISQIDSRVRVFHKENGGLGSARNVAIDNARGDFLYFFDVDDSIEPNLIEDNVHMAQEKKADLIIFGYYARYSNEQTEEAITLNEHEIHTNEKLKEVYAKELLWLKHGNGFAWNKFYRRSFIEQYKFRFGNQRIQQDEPFNMQLYLHLDNVYICPKAYYHYVLYVNSNAGSRYLPDKADIITDIYHRFMDFYYSWNLNDERVLNYIQQRFITGIFGVVTWNFYHKDCHMSKKEKTEIISSILDDQDVKSVLKHTRIAYSKNPVNSLQAWAFNHRVIKILMLATCLKMSLKKLLKE